jgi:hypothetical protein
LIRSGTLAFIVFIASASNAWAAGEQLLHGAVEANNALAVFKAMNLEPSTQAQSTAFQTAFRAGYMRVAVTLVVLNVESHTGVMRQMREEMEASTTEDNSASLERLAVLERFAVLTADSPDDAFYLRARLENGGWTDQDAIASLDEGLLNLARQNAQVQNEENVVLPGQIVEETNVVVQQVTVMPSEGSGSSSSFMPSSSTSSTTSKNNDTSSCGCHCVVM